MLEIVYIYIIIEVLKSGGVRGVVTMRLGFLRLIFGKEWGVGVDLSIDLEIFEGWVLSGSGANKSEKELDKNEGVRKNQKVNWSLKLKISSKSKSWSFLDLEKVLILVLILIEILIVEICSSKSYREKEKTTLLKKLTLIKNSGAVFWRYNFYFWPRPR